MVNVLGLTFRRNLESMVIPDVKTRMCPQCGDHRVRRSGRRGLWDHLVSAVRLYPFRCDACRCRFRRFYFPWQ